MCATSVAWRLLAHTMYSRAFIQHLLHNAYKVEIQSMTCHRAIASKFERTRQNSFLFHTYIRVFLVLYNFWWILPLELFLIIEFLIELPVLKLLFRLIFARKSFLLSPYLQFKNVRAMLDSVCMRSLLYDWINFICYLRSERWID